MKRFVLVSFFLCAALLAFSNDFYRVKSGTVNARSWASASSDVIGTYKQGEVLSISEYVSDGRYKWGKVAGTYPAQWVAVSNLTKMSQEEINDYFLNKQNVAAQPQKKKVRAPRTSTDYSFFILKILISIYSVLIFILFYEEAKKREKTVTHASYGVCCLVLLFWVFFTSKWQWLWVGFFWAGLCYPLAYAKFVEKEGYISALIETAAMLLCGISTWYILCRCDIVTSYVGEFSWFEVACLIVVNTLVSAVFGSGCIVARCPLCHYFCASHTVNSTYDGSTYYDVNRTKMRDRWYDRRVEEEYHPHKITITDYYELETTRTTSTYRRDFHTTTYYCPHCHRNYDIQSYIDHFISRKETITYKR